MNCLLCGTPNEEGSNYCANCGTGLTYAAKSSSSSKSSDTLLIIYICIAFFTGILQFGIDRVFPDWFESPVRYLKGGLWMLQNISFILIALAIKNKNLKVIGIVLTTILILYWLYGNLEFMIRDF